jgi:nucleoside-diphosphate-sugar epimerase
LEAAYQATGFPWVIVRPSLTYGEDQVPLVLNAWSHSWTTIDRLRRGVPVIIPGDGNSLWTITHNTDFARGLTELFGNPAAIGQAFHITSDEVLTWNQIFHLAAEAAGVREPKFLHIPSDFIIACVPAVEGTLLGDKAVSTVFDNAKIKRFVPGLRPRSRSPLAFVKRSRGSTPSSRAEQVDVATNQRWDRLTAAYSSALAEARSRFIAS